MSVPLEQFVQQLEDSGIVAGDTLKDFLPPKASPATAEELVDELIRKNKLTKFQAEEVSKGKGKSLVLGNYVLMEKIGAGGMGQVFKAEHRRMHRIVAIKLLPTNLTRDVAAIARFEREVTAAAKLNHPNIVTAYDADQADGVHFLVMELVEGSDLSVLVKKNGPFPVEKAVNYILQAARGLEAAHAEGIVHRDIKPGNLLLDKKETVKILDMGLARLTLDEDEAPQAELTSTGTVMGTVDYMAPEQAEDTRTADARADIYSLGCSLFYLLTGRVCYEAETLIKRVLAHRDKPIPSIRAKRPEVPEYVETIFKKMVAKTVEDRFQSMTELILDLERRGSSESTLKSFEPSAKATPERTATFSILDMTSGESTILTPSAEKSAPSRTDKNKRLAWIGAGVLGVAMLAGIIVKLPTTDVNSTESASKQSVAASLAPLKNSSSPKVKKPLAFQTPGFDQWVKGVAKLSAEEQVEAVSKKLVDLNPGFDGKVTGWESIGEDQPRIENGVVVSFGFSTDEIDDISPVRGLAKLENVWCCGSGKGLGKLEDLSPLQGMPLLQVACNSTNVSDLSPLIGLKLRTLVCIGTKVSDLSPIKGMPLNWFGCAYTPVSDLSALRGSDLHWLSIIDTQVSDLSALKELPLETLFCGGVKVTDLSSLSGLPLKALSCDFKPERDTELLRSFKNLEIINHKPAVEFWKEVEEKQKATKLGYQMPGFDQWVKDVKAMPAEYQVDAVSKKLVELNPDFDGKIAGYYKDATPTIENGVVTMIGFVTDNVTDISPVRALKGLVRLSCCGSERGQGQLADLSPLKGMRLRALACYNTKISDLSPLAGMQLFALVCNDTLVSDLSPLRGLPLTEFSCSGTQVSDLSALQGMPLAWLIIANTQVSELSSLKGMPLANFGCAGTQISDLSILKGMPLKSVGVEFSDVSDLSPLIGMPITTFYCHMAKVTDLSPLKGMPLKVLSCDFKPERDTELLRSFKELESINHKPAAEFWKEVEEKQKRKKLGYQMLGFDQWMKGVQAQPAEQQVEAVSKKLMELNPGFEGKVTDHGGKGTPLIENGVVTQFGFDNDNGTQNVTDISPLRALGGLKRLWCGLAQGQLADLSPLTGMQLETLVCPYTRISDLSPLTGMKLEVLDCPYTQVSDLSPLRRMPLGLLCVAGTPVSDISILHGMMSLKKLMIDKTRVTDLHPLQGINLELFSCEGVSVSDLSVLKEMPLKYLSCDFKPERDTEILRTIKTLEQINNKPVVVFWKEVAERQKGKNP